MDYMDQMEAMGEDQFWAMIALVDQDYAAFKDLLQHMSREELIGFSWEFQDLVGPVYEVIENEDAFTEDRLQDLTAWVVARGKDFYQHVLDNPKEMPTELDLRQPGLDVLGQAIQAYYDRFGEDMPIYGGY
jgi:hypothetical protein